MFGLFKSKRNKIKELGERAFDNYIPALKGMYSSEIGYVLDQDIFIRDRATMYEKHQSHLEIFMNPMAVPENVAFGVLQEWKRQMIALGGTVEGRAQVGSFSIWYLSVIACQIGELRLRGRELWTELERGYQYAEYFYPDVDCVVELEPIS